MNEHIGRHGQEQVRQKQREAIRAYRHPEHPRSRQAVERAVRDRYPDTPEARQHLAEYLFSLPKGTELAPEELHDIQRFAEYVGKRFVHAEMYSPLLAGSPTDGPSDFGVFQEHDVAHGIAEYARSGQESVVPEVLRTTQDVYCDPLAMQDELFATLWGGNVAGDTMFNRITRMEGVDDLAPYVESPEAFARLRTELEGASGKTFEGAFALLLGAAREDFRRAAIRTAESEGRDTSSYVDPDGPLDAAFAHIKDHPDPKMIEVMRAIYEQRDDPKILLKEFQRVCGPLLESLRARKQYSDETRQQRRDDAAAAKKKLEDLRRRPF